jgi:hypothetical protein
MNDQKITASLLNLCTRGQSHPVQEQELARLCKGFTQWDQLLFTAEHHGMAPLLYMHLTRIQADLPDDFIRGLRLLKLRHKQANSLLMSSLQEILPVLESNGIRCLVLKGAALCQTVYRDIGLRPMRDIDLLLAKEDVHRAHALLETYGFHCGGDTLPEDYYHLPPLFKNLEGMRICVELHHGLFPDDPPYYQQLDFEELYQNRKRFEVGDAEAFTMADEDMLWHLFQHGFRAPLTYEPYRLISVADIVTVVEDRLSELNWDKLAKRYPRLLNALPLFHYITPWNDDVLLKNTFKTKRRVLDVGEPYSGWPLCTLSEIARPEFLKVFCKTVYPGQWWTMLYYGKNMGISLFWYRIVTHPVHLLRWVKIYIRKSIKGKNREESRGNR